MKKLEITVYKTGFEMGNIIKKDTYYPAHIEFHIDLKGKFLGFEVSEVGFENKLLRTAYYDGAHYTYSSAYK